jgi:uncharacterized protein (DUF1697 family)
MKNIPDRNDQITYAAFLRGVNVGGNSVIKMDDLRGAFEALGFRNVKTVLASGNVLFEAPREDITKLSENITRGLRKTFERDILAIVCSIDELRELEARQPFKDIGEAPGTRSFITFLSKKTKTRDITGASDHEGFRILSCSDGVICSVLFEHPGGGTVKLMGAIEKEFGPNVTTRTWNTIIRVLKTNNERK